METLKEKIDLYHRAKKAYYSPESSEYQEPILTDEEFDALEDELIESGYDTTIGTNEDVQTKKVKHNVKMLSLGKYKVLEDEMSIELATEIYQKYGRGRLSWKYDGLALEAQYKDGFLQVLCTRGDGIEGRNVTDKFKHLVPNQIDYKEQVDIRFEAIMNERIFEEKYSSTYKHSRNLVSGIFGDINIDDKRKFDIDVRVIELINPSTKRFLQPGEVDNFFVQKYKEHQICNSANDIKNVFDQAVKTRSDFNIGTDGMVYASIDQQSFEYNGNHPTYAIAIKFKPPRLISTITEIKWKLSRTGRYVPIIQFKPLIVDGRSIRKASGYNFKYLLDNDLCVGKQVQIILSNDIIPMVKPIR